VLLDDLDLAVLAPLDHGGVVGVDQARLGVQLVHQLIVRFRVLDAVVDPNERHQRVNRHRFSPSCSTASRVMLCRPR